MEMDMNDVNFAHLHEDTLNDIKKLEKQLSTEMNREIILLAYEQRDDANGIRDTASH
ncbi:hypothetical protein [Alicyclobacillus dauci]|uniref:Spo0E like sporulation regulatory protein n=1 Tax=Alicyclobacillus dauci TaxID=1475485 RepID=A0ABY6Z7F8_9BACL|nr:hypothetical protein [Alicyclobacillus dauci]WAH38821.1 hypothetical protein NZD86_10245 [Alicyclobacillus dauci]